MYLIVIFVLIMSSCSPSDTNEDSADTQSSHLDIYHLGNITLSQNNVLTLDNKRIILDGSVTIEDQAILTLTNGTLEFDQAYSQQHRLEVHNNAQLNISNMSLAQQATWMNWEFYDNSSSTQNTFIHGSELWTGVHGANTLSLTNSSVACTFMATSTASLNSSDADFVHLEMALPASGSPYNFTFPNGATNMDWDSPTGLPYKISLKRSNIHSIDVDILDGVNVIISNTHDARFGWVFGLGDSYNHGYSDTITGLKNKKYIDQTFTTGSGSRVSTLRLVNSSVADWWPTVWSNHTLNLDDCTMADPRGWDNSRININNSTMTMLGAYSNSVVNIFNSTIDGFLIALNNSHIILTNVTFDGTITADQTARISRDGIIIAP